MYGIQIDVNYRGSKLYVPNFITVTFTYSTTDMYVQFIWAWRKQNIFSAKNK
jgi:hypothetical protein